MAKDFDDNHLVELLVFDMGHVFVDFEWEQVCAGFCKRAGVSSEEFSSALGYLGTLGYEKGNLSSREFLSELNTRLSSDISDSEFADLWTHTFRENADMIRLLQHLQGKIPLYLLSNTNDVHFRFVEDRFNVSRHFDELILSYEVGSTKPEERIYHEVLRRSGLAPSRCLFIDDLQPNIDAASSLGMRAIQFFDYPTLMSELSALPFVGTDLVPTSGD